MSAPNPEILSILGSDPFELKDDNDKPIGVNGAFVWEQLKRIERSHTVSDTDISKYLFIVQDPNTLNLATINKRQVLLAMLMNQVHALHKARNPEDTMEFESDLIDKYK